VRPETTTTQRDPLDDVLRRLATDDNPRVRAWAEQLIDREAAASAAEDHELDRYELLVRSADGDGEVAE
jgi:hypothetical protein